MAYAYRYRVSKYLETYVSSQEKIGEGAQTYRVTMTVTNSIFNFFPY